MGGVGEISDQTVGNILKRRGISPTPERRKTTTWKAFIRMHMDVLWTTDFFTETRQVHIAGVTLHPNEAWMKQMARNLTMDEWGILQPGHYLMHDHDTKFCAACKQRLDDAGVKRVPLPPRAPWLNAFAER
jgi:putative transposase